MKKPHPHATVILDEETRDAVEAYRRRQRAIPSLSSALNSLIKSGLVAEEAAGK